MVGIPLSVLLAAEWGSSGATAALAVSQSLTVLLAVRRCYRIVRDLLRTEEQSGSPVASAAAGVSNGKGGPG
jgi:hypothetical protein